MNEDLWDDIELGAGLAKAREFEQAIELLKSCLVRSTPEDDSDSTAHHCLASCYEGQGRLQEALKEFDYAIQACSKYDFATRNVNLVYRLRFLGRNPSLWQSELPEPASFLDALRCTIEGVPEKALQLAELLDEHPEGATNSHSVGRFTLAEFYLPAELESAVGHLDKGIEYIQDPKDYARRALESYKAHILKRT